ncbi:MAG TPA: hypothetical protein DEB39_01060 [Planctomycetaceae bacterium]|nr:hypothetical protein [Planctomycetaceae bacterium]
MAYLPDIGRASGLWKGMGDLVNDVCWNKGPLYVHRRNGRPLPPWNALILCINGGNCREKSKRDSQ